jgi:hypothetical protein
MFVPEIHITFSYVLNDKKYRVFLQSKSKQILLCFKVNNYVDSIHNLLIILCGVLLFFIIKLFAWNI